MAASRDTLMQRSRSKRPSEKAAWNQDGRVKREFFDLSTADETAISEQVGFAVDANLRATEGNAPRG